MEDERLETEKELRAKIEAIEQEMKEKFEMGTKKGPSGQNTQAMGMGQYDTLYKLKVKMDKAIEPQVQTHEERIEKLINEVRDVTAAMRRMQDVVAKKSDRTELEPVMMRIAVWENIKPQTLLSSLQKVEDEISQNRMITEHVALQVQKVEAVMCTKEVVDKLKTEIMGVKKDCSSLKAELKEANTQQYITNRTMQANRDEFEQLIDKLEKKLTQEKATKEDVAEVAEKLRKIEFAHRDNRQLLEGAGGNEVSDVVKRIILNMEDKIMLIDRKVENLMQNGPPSNGPVLSPKA